MEKIDLYIRHLLLVVLSLTCRYFFINQTNDLLGLMEDMNVYEDWRTYQRPADLNLVQLIEIENESVMVEADLKRTMAEISTSGSYRSRRVWQKHVMQIQHQLQNLQTEVRDTIQTQRGRTARRRGISIRTFGGSMVDLQAILTPRGRTARRRALIWSMLKSKNSEENTKDPLRFSSCPDIPELLDDLDMHSFQKSDSMNTTLDFKDPKRRILQKLYDDITNLAQRFYTTRHSSELRDQNGDDGDNDDDPTAQDRSYNNAGVSLSQREQCGRETLQPGGSRARPRAPGLSRDTATEGTRSGMPQGRQDTPPKGSQKGRQAGGAPTAGRHAPADGRGNRPRPCDGSSKRSQTPRPGPSNQGLSRTPTNVLPPRGETWAPSAPPRFLYTTPRLPPNAPATRRPPRTGRQAPLSHHAPEARPPSSRPPGVIAASSRPRLPGSSPIQQLPRPPAPRKQDPTGGPPGSPPIGPLKAPPRTHPPPSGRDAGGEPPSSIPR